MKVKTYKRIIAVIMSFVMIGIVVPTNTGNFGLTMKANAVGIIIEHNYYVNQYWNEEYKQVVNERVDLDISKFKPIIDTSLIKVDSILTYTDEQDNTWWYVQKNTTFSERIYATGTAQIIFDGITPIGIELIGSLNIILADGVTLNCEKGIGVNSGATLNIYGQAYSSGKLIAGSESYNAAIGSDDQDTDKGKNGCGTINIFGGTIEATSSTDAAGIGGGNEAECGNVTIYGGTITANGGAYGAGIGGGDEAETAAGKIIIYGGTVTAQGGSEAAGIGGGSEGSGPDISVCGGTITATGGYYGAGIGSGQYRAECHIRIDDGNVTATGGEAAAGIGSGFDPFRTNFNGGYMGEILINGGDIKAYGGYTGAGIGTGGSDVSKYGNGNIIITNGKVEAVGNNGGAGIGTGTDSECRLNILISGGEVKAICGADINRLSCESGAGIGSGSYCDFSGRIEIDGGKVYANGLNTINAYPGLEYYYGGAGIGSGYSGSVTSDAEIVINGGEIQVIGESGGAAIGSGAEADMNFGGGELEGKVTINGGHIEMRLSNKKDCVYIGHGCEGDENGTLLIGSNMKVNFKDSVPVQNALRNETCQREAENVLVITKCDHPGKQYTVSETTHTQTCMYCYTAFTAEAHNMDSQNYCTDCGYQGTLYDISFDVDSDSGVDNMISIVPGSNYILPECNFTAPDGMVFKCWKIGETEYQPGDEITINSDTDITAVWVEACIVHGTNITLGGELGLNFYVSIPDELVNEGAKFVMDGPEGTKEIAPSTLTKDNNNRYKVTYKLTAIKADQAVTFKITDSNGTTLNIYNSLSERISDDVFCYGAYDYFKLALKESSGLTDDQKAKVRATYTYCAYAVKWKYGTALPTDGNINPLPDITWETDEVKEHKLAASGTNDNISISGISLLLDSKTAFKLYFSCNDDISGHTIKLDGVDVNPTLVSGQNYYIRLNNIGANKLQIRHEIIFDSYSVTFDAMSYVYSALKDDSSTDELKDIVKAIYAYSEEFK